MLKLKKTPLTILYPYRSFHNEQFNTKLLWFFLLPVIFNLIILFFLNDITSIWGTFFQLYLPQLGYENGVSYQSMHFLNTDFLVPYINIMALPPTNDNLLITLISSLIVILFSYFIPDNFTPVKYFLRAMIFVLFTAMIYFYFSPYTFPYNVPDYSKMGLLFTIGLMFATPWIFAFTYYLLGYEYLNKIVITTLVLLFLIIGAPIQYLVNSYIVINLSLLFIPPLYIFLSLLTQVFVIIAFYSYGVSVEESMPVERIAEI